MAAVVEIVDQSGRVALRLRGSRRLPSDAGALGSAARPVTLIEKGEPVLVMAARDAVGCGSSGPLADRQPDHCDLARCENGRRWRVVVKLPWCRSSYGRENAFLIEFAHLSTFGARFVRSIHSYTFICIQINNPA